MPNLLKVKQMLNVEDLSKGIINPAPIVVRAPDLRKRIDLDLVKELGSLTGDTLVDFKN